MIQTQEERFDVLRPSVSKTKSYVIEYVDGSGIEKSIDLGDVDMHLAREEANRASRLMGVSVALVRVNRELIGHIKATIDNKSR
jgi:hypothetical protein